MERYLEERAALETKYLDLCNPLYKERGNVVSRRLDDGIKRSHKEGGGENAGKREGAASLEDASDDDKIYGAVASG